MNRTVYSTSTEQARMRATGRAGMLAVAAATENREQRQRRVLAILDTYLPAVRYGTCPMHNCDGLVWFKQAEDEAPGVGRWLHVDPALNPNTATGFGHVVPAGVE